MFDWLVVVCVVCARLPGMIVCVCFMMFVLGCMCVLCCCWGVISCGLIVCAVACCCVLLCA